VRWLPWLAPRTFQVTSHGAGSGRWPFWRSELSRAAIQNTKRSINSRMNAVAIAASSTDVAAAITVCRQVICSAPIAPAPSCPHRLCKGHDSALYQHRTWPARRCPFPLALTSLSSIISAAACGEYRRAHALIGARKARFFRAFNLRCKVDRMRKSRTVPPRGGKPTPTTPAMPDDSGIGAGREAEW
jgi:hypothetical protein